MVLLHIMWVMASAISAIPVESAGTCPASPGNDDGAFTARAENGASLPSAAVAGVSRPPSQALPVMTGICRFGNSSRSRFLTERRTTVASIGAVPPDYKWNKDARGYVYVDIGIKWVTEHGPNKTVFSGLKSTRETRFAAVIELDKDPSDPTAKIIGGEYLDKPDIGANRLTVPPFVWVADPSRVTDTALRHNPYVKASAVKKLVDSVVGFQERSLEIVNEMRTLSTKNSAEIRDAVEDGKRRIARLVAEGEALPING